MGTVSSRMFHMLSILRHVRVGTKNEQGRWSCLAAAPSLTKCSGILSFQMFICGGYAAAIRPLPCAELTERHIVASVWNTSVQSVSKVFSCSSLCVLTDACTSNLQQWVDTFYVNGWPHSQCLYEKATLKKKKKAFMSCGSPVALCLLVTLESPFTFNSGCFFFICAQIRREKSEILTFFFPQPKCTAL